MFLDGDKPVVAETFTVGDKVTFKDGLFAKKYPGTYDVTLQKGKYTYITLVNKLGVKESVGFDSTEFTKK